MMTAAEDKPRNTPDDPFFDPWSGWHPDWKRPHTPHAQQERNAPTRAPAEPEARHRRRITDARLWESLSPARQDAALEIHLACETMGRGLGFTISDWRRIPGCRGPGSVAEAHARLVNAYIDWTRACHKAKVSHAMIFDILVLGHSLGESDKNRRVRKGTSRANLLEGLALYCKLKGWPV